MRTLMLFALAGTLAVLAFAFAPGRGADAASAASISGIAVVQAQEATPSPQATSAGDDNRVEIMWVAFGLAGGAIILLSAGYLLRGQLGLIKPPPPQPSDHDGHH